MLNPWFGKALILAGNALGIAIRVPHDSRNKKVSIAEDRRGPREVVLLAMMTIGVMILPLLAIATPLLAFADYPLSAWSFACGMVCLTFNFWLFHRSHADLGTNWSMTLQIRNGHSLVTSGVYKHLRHPMYAAIYLFTLAQAFLLSNWIAGPAGLVAFTFMFAFRLGPEEQMMLDKFGDDYHAYAARTKRLIPGIW